MAYSKNKVFQELARMQADCSVPGVAVGIINGKSIETFTNGITNINNPLDIDETTLFQIASITKTFAALLTLLLCKQNIIELDTPIIKYLPEFKMKDKHVTEELTIRHILTHTGGWEGDILEYPDKGEDTLKETMKIVSLLPQITPLGRAWAYNPVGFYIFGYLLEQILHMSYEQILRKYLFEPLGMSSSVFTANEAIIHKVAVGHYIVDGKPVVATPWELARCTRPSAGVVTSLSDMLKYLRFLLFQGQKGVFGNDQNLICEMLTEQFQASGKADAIGLAWMLRYVDGIKVCRHGGVAMGQYSEMLFVPERNFGLIILTNGGDESFIESATDKLLNHYAGLLLHRQFPSSISTPSSDLNKYVARYNGFSNDIDVMLGEEGLIVKYNYKKVFKNQKSVPDAPPPMSLVFYEPNRAYIKENRTMCDFIMDDYGKIKFLRHGNKIHVRMDF